MFPRHVVAADDALWHAARAVIFEGECVDDAGAGMGLTQEVKPVQLLARELAAATEGFSEKLLIGAGGFGFIFRATRLLSLPHPGPLAIKRLPPEEDVKKEIALVSTCHHPNLLPLLGFSLHPNACLVYPLMGETRPPQVRPLPRTFAPSPPPPTPRATSSSRTPPTTPLMDAPLA